MEAYVLEAIGKYNLKEVEKPIPNQEEVLVQVKASGICGSDIPRIFKTGTYNYPLIPGHEFSGIVVDENNDSFAETESKALANPMSFSWRGKRVGVFPLIPCGKCELCKQKKYEMCLNYGYIGSRQDGGNAEYVRVPKWNLIELPNDVSFEQAAMLEPMAVAVHAIRRVLEVFGVDIWDINAKEKLKGTDIQDMDNGTITYKSYERLLGKTVAVCGLGTIGLLLVMFLKDIGFKRIIAIGNKDIQKQKALEIGIVETLYCDARTVKLKDWAIEKKLNIDIFFDCVGQNSVINQAIDCTSPSGIVMLVGNPVSDICLERNLYWKILRNQLTLLGTWNSSFAHEATDDWNYVLDRLTLSAIYPEQLISHRYRFGEFADGFNLMNEKREEYIKVMGNISENN